MWYEEMFEQLEKEGDELQAKKMSAYMQNQFPFLGIPKPNLMAFIKPYFSQLPKSQEIDWTFLQCCWDKEYREAQYIGEQYLKKYRKKLKYTDLNQLKYLIITKPWWDIADNIDQRIAELSLVYPQIKEDMLDWSKSENLWLRRVAIDFQQELKQDTDTQLLEEIICNCMETNEFFINKAIGWSLRDYRKTNPTWVDDFTGKYEDQLSALSLKEARK